MMKRRTRLNEQQQLARSSRTFAVRLDRLGWCDLFHVHFDMYGRGNASRAQRLVVLNALLRALCRARLELRGQDALYQLFALVDLADSGNDALYVHTPNPNGTPFPSPIESFSVPTPALPPLLAGRVPRASYEVRRLSEPGSSVYYLIPLARES